jgi:hypothetical protein
MDLLVIGYTACQNHAYGFFRSKGRDTDQNASGQKQQAEYVPESIHFHYPTLPFL